MPRIPGPRGSLPTGRLPGLRRVALCLAGSIVVGGAAAPRLAAANEDSTAPSVRPSAVSTSSNPRESARAMPAPPRPEPAEPVPHKSSKRGGKISRAEVIRRAKYWYDHRDSIPYSMESTSTHRDPDSASHGYRRDCSGFVSMALHLTSSLNTVTLPDVGIKISRTAMQPGDVTGILGAGTAGSAGHVRVFEKWADKRTGRYWAYDFGSAPVKHQIYQLSKDAPRSGIGWTAYRYKKID